MDRNTVEKVKWNINEVMNKLHDQLISLYNDHPFENDENEVNNGLSTTSTEQTETDRNAINNFNFLLNYYNEYIDNVNYVYDDFMTFPGSFNSEEEKENFRKVWNDVILPDRDAFNCLNIRRRYFQTYMLNRDDIILTIFRKQKLVRNTKNKPFDTIFTFFVRKYSSTKLDKLSAKGFFDRTEIEDMKSIISRNIMFSSGITEEETFKLFQAYQLLRNSVADIYDGLTSPDPKTGYAVYGKDYLIKFCKNALKWPDLSKLIMLYVPIDLDDPNFEKMYKDYYFIQIDKKFLTESNDSRSKSGLNEGYDILDPDFEPKDRSDVVGIKAVPTDFSNGQVRYDKKLNGVFTNTDFWPGDIIEVCPCKMVNSLSLYSDEVRSLVFEVVPNEQYAIPFGYACYYDLADDEHPANAEYTWDPNTETIVITSLARLPKSARLYLNGN